jgi:hypothetical protein
VLAVAATHPLAAKESISIEEVADFDVMQPPDSFPRELFDELVPPRTPSGRELRRKINVVSFHEVLSLVALGRAVHPTVRSLPVIRDDIQLVPIRDLPSMSLGLIWSSAHVNARILALADVARQRAAIESEPSAESETRDRSMRRAASRSAAGPGRRARSSGRIQGGSRSA